MKNIGHRPTWIEIDLKALRYNFRQVKRLVSGDTKIMICVKKDAYGHGSLKVAHALVREGVDYFGVASMDEGIILRRDRILKPILVLGTVLSTDLAPIIKYNLAATVCSNDLAIILNKKAKAKNKIVNIHIKVDTGMGRLGVLHKDAFDFINRIKRLKFLNIQGVFTHFPIADTNQRFTRYQIELFNQLKTRLERRGVNIPLFHAANSMATIGYRNSYFNLVRPGLMVYGIYPKSNIRLKLKPVMSLKTRIIYLKRVPKNYGISYGHIYRTNKSTKIVTLPIGYGDGYFRYFSNKGCMLIRGRRFKVAGRVCMDQTMVDIGNLNTKVGEEVVLMGRQGKQKITAEELASLIGTIPYEIVCNLGNRLPRLYRE